MKRQNLLLLNVTQLTQYKKTLSNRINEDLKLFNLDLGRENLYLSQQYRRKRQQKDKILKGYPLPKKSIIYNKNNLYGDQFPKNSIRQQKNFNFDDIYKVGKGKVAQWWGKGKKSNKSNDTTNLNTNINTNINTDLNAKINTNINTNINQSQNQAQQHLYYQQSELPQQIYCDLPQPIPMPYPQLIPQYYQILQIISQQHCPSPSIQKSSSTHQYYYHPFQHQHHHYYGLHQQSTNQQTKVKEVKPLYKNQQGESKEVPSYHGTAMENGKANKKGFQFDDLPGMGWKKLKGMMGWKAKGKAQENVQSVQQSPQSVQSQLACQYSRHHPNNSFQFPHQFQTLQKAHSSSIPTSFPQSNSQPRRRIPIFASKQQNVQHNAQEDISQTISQKTKNQQKQKNEQNMIKCQEQV